MAHLWPGDNARVKYFPQSFDTSYLNSGVDDRTIADSGAHFRLRGGSGGTSSRMVDKGKDLLGSLA
jgi:hypothetical protein